MAKHLFLRITVNGVCDETRIKRSVPVHLWNQAKECSRGNTATDLSEYETIIVAAPLWWSNMAAPLQTFLFNYGDQMAGKNIGLIVSSASSGISGVEADAKRLIPGGSFFEPSLWIRSSQTSNSNTLISSWLTEIK